MCNSMCVLKEEERHSSVCVCICVRTIICTYVVYVCRRIRSTRGVPGGGADEDGGTSQQTPSQKRVKLLSLHYLQP